MIIVLGHQKGGVGKTTLAAAIGARLLHLGKRVSFLDADPQRSLLKWGKRAGLPIEFAQNDLRAVVKNLSARSEYVVVDVSGRDGPELRSVLLRAQVWLAPFGPAQVDIDTLPWMHGMLQELVELNPAIHWFTCINRLPFNFGKQKILEEMRGFLGDSLCGFIHDRKFFRTFLEGSLDWEDERAAEEIDQLIRGVGAGK